MKIVAVTNIKGGVGKTTTAVNLAFLCAAGGQSTLLWDLDPQAAASYILQSEPHEHASAKKLVAGKRELPELLVPSGYDNLDVLPADFSYRHFDLHLSERKRPTERLLKMSRSLRAADAVVVPLLPTPLSLRMLTQLREFVLANEWTDLALLPFSPWDTCIARCGARLQSGWPRGRRKSLILWRSLRDSNSCSSLERAVS